MTPEEKYSDLLKKIGDQFQKSNIKNIQDKRQWNYALCGTPIKKEAGIILGINWGGKGDHPISKEMPNGSGVQDYLFLKRTKEKLQKSLGIELDKLNFNYSNFCFFRSPKASDLVHGDFDLCWNILEEYIYYIQPPWILSLGLSIVDVLQKMENTSLKYNLIKTNTYSAVSGYKGDLLGYNFYVLPHPNYRIKNDLRNKIWHNIFPGKF